MKVDQYGTDKISSSIKWNRRKAFFVLSPDLKIYNPNLNENLPSAREQDSLALLFKELHEGKTKNIYMMNAANATKAGGGFEGNGTVQEEMLCANTTLYPSLKEVPYPIKDSILLTKNVKSILYKNAYSDYEKSKSKDFFSNYVAGLNSSYDVFAELNEIDQSPGFGVFSASALNRSSYEKFCTTTLFFTMLEKWRLVFNSIENEMRLQALVPPSRSLGSYVGNSIGSYVGSAVGGSLGGFLGSAVGGNLGSVVGVAAKMVIKGFLGNFAKDFAGTVSDNTSAFKLIAAIPGSGVFSYFPKDQDEERKPDPEYAKANAAAFVFAYKAYCPKNLEVILSNVDNCLGSEIGYFFGGTQVNEDSEFHHNEGIVRLWQFIYALPPENLILKNRSEDVLKSGSSFNAYIQDWDAVTFSRTQNTPPASAQNTGQPPFIVYNIDNTQQYATPFDVFISNAPNLNGGLGENYHVTYSTNKNRNLQNFVKSLVPVAGPSAGIPAATPVMVAPPVIPVVAASSVAGPSRQISAQGIISNKTTLGRQIQDWSDVALQQTGMPMPQPGRAAAWVLSVDKVTGSFEVSLRDYRTKLCTNYRVTYDKNKNPDLYNFIRNK